MNHGFIYPPLQISYYNQASPEVLPYISTDIAGLSSSFYNTFCSCSQYLTKYRLQSFSEEQPGQQDRLASTHSSSREGGAERLSETLRSTQL